MQQNATTALIDCGGNGEDDDDELGRQVANDTTPTPT